MSGSFIANFKAGVEKMNAFPDKHIIGRLTHEAGKNATIAASIVYVLETMLHDERIPAKNKLPIFYLVDSILKNIQAPYVKLFSRNVDRWFVAVYDRMDSKLQYSMSRVLGTWEETRMFSKSLLARLRAHVSGDPTPIPLPVTGCLAATDKTSTNTPSPPSPPRDQIQSPSPEIEDIFMEPIEPSEDMDVQPFSPVQLPRSTPPPPQESFLPESRPSFKPLVEPHHVPSSVAMDPVMHTTKRTVIGSQEYHTLVDQRANELLQINMQQLGSTEEMSLGKLWNTDPDLAMEFRTLAESQVKEDINAYGSLQPLPEPKVPAIQPQQPPIMQPHLPPLPPQHLPSPPIPPNLPLPPISLGLSHPPVPLPIPPSPVKLPPFVPPVVPPLQLELPLQPLPPAGVTLPPPPPPALQPYEVQMLLQQQLAAGTIVKRKKRTRIQQPFVQVDYEKAKGVAQRLVIDITAAAAAVSKGDAQAPLLAAAATGTAAAIAELFGIGGVGMSFEMDTEEDESIAIITSNMMNVEERPQYPPVNAWDKISLGTRFEGPIFDMYYGRALHCKQDGQRFKTQEALDSHLDLLFQRRRMRRESGSTSRPWYPTLNQWVTDFGTKGTSVSVEKMSKAVPTKEVSILTATDNVTEAIEEGVSTEIALNENEEFDFNDAIVPADEDQPNCRLCGEPFDMYYDSDEEEWMYRNAAYAVLSSDDSEKNEAPVNIILHHLCLEASGRNGVPLKPSDLIPVDSTKRKRQQGAGSEGTDFESIEEKRHRNWL